MTEEKIETAKPTRMELLGIRRRLSLAEKGHKLLEDKRDALVEKFFESIKRRDELKKEIDELFGRAFEALTEAQMVIGVEKVKAASGLIEGVSELSMYTENIMGVRVPKITFEKLELKAKPLYSLSDTCAKLDDAFLFFSKLLPKLLELAEIDGAVQSLAGEIEKTKRRVNVLENVLIPKLKATRKYIEMQLEEREREDFFRRKRIKAIMERREYGYRG
ncbi:MAG TPA: V-type ATP synthase subunit D [Thermoplasmatales archaeon]|nr:V-type ATP synthase subunit D [Thermoplasmatales archaeon]